MLETGSKDLIEVSKTLREAFEKGQKAGRQEGFEKGRREAVETMLHRLFMRRLGRALTEREQQALAARTQDPELAEDRALSLEGEALAAWLLDPGAK